MVSDPNKVTLSKTRFNILLYLEIGVGQWVVNCPGRTYKKVKLRGLTEYDIEQNGYHLTKVGQFQLDRVT